MSSHLASHGIELRPILEGEIDANVRGLSGYADWSDADRKAIVPILADEKQRINSTSDLVRAADSVKGESAMKVVYAPYSKKASDVITLLPNASLVLTEAKYLIRVGSAGPFGGVSSFRERISGKFTDMQATMLPDGENVLALHVIVLAEEQLPLMISRVRGLLSADYPPGTFSYDCQQHTYALCASGSLRQVLDKGVNHGLPSSQCYVFRI